MESDPPLGQHYSSVLGSNSQGAMTDLEHAVEAGFLVPGTGVAGSVLRICLQEEHKLRGRVLQLRS